MKVGEEILEEFLTSGWSLALFPSSNKSNGNDIIDVFSDMPDHKAPLYFTHHQRLEGVPNAEAFYEFLKEVSKVWVCPQKR